jgi:hypothetical protein
VEGFWVQVVTGPHNGETRSAGSKYEAENLALDLSERYQAMVDVMVTSGGVDTMLGCMPPGGPYQYH